jgi:fructose-1,6-bisphosphatase II
VYRNEADRVRTKGMAIDDLERIYDIHDLAQGHVMFSATGVTQGTYLDGVRFTRDGAITHSVVMRSESGTIRFIETEHYFDRAPEY